MKRKVAFFGTSGYGGAENMTILYARILMAHGFDCSLLIVKKLESETINTLDYIPDNLPMEVVVTRYRWAVFHIYKYLKREKPDAVFCTMPDLSMLLLILKKLGLYRGKVVVRDSNMPSRQTSRVRKLGMRFYRYADVLIAQTNEMRDEMLTVYGLTGENIKVINNPTDEDKIKGKIASHFDFDHHFTNYVSVGRICGQKDYLTAIRAFALVLREHPDSRYYIIGGESDGEYAASIHDETRHLGIAEKVFFEGYQDNPYKYQDGCDAYVLSSIYEGLPNTMLDAMYLGKPVAATECIPYIAQVVHNGQNGYTVKVGDYKALADAMIKASQIKNLPKFVPVNDSIGKILQVFDC